MRGIDPLEPGSVLAERYRIGPPLGSGGMSVVHRGTDEVLGREVAIKALVQSGADAAELQRVEAEVDLLATLSHRSLVTLFDAGSATHGGQTVTYLVMELVDGPTLAQRVAAAPLEPTDIARMARDLAEALVVIHARGVVHRDIKPANILLAPSPLPGHEFDAKLADFGIASLVDAARRTETGTVLGTAAYLSPEQATGERVTPASDVYSLGLVLLEAITGRREYPGPPLEALSARQARDPLVPDGVGGDWAPLLRAMTDRDPAARPTAAAVLERLSDGPGGAPLTPMLADDRSDTAPTIAAAAIGSAAAASAAPAAVAGATSARAASTLDGHSATAASPRADERPITAELPIELPVSRPRRRRRGWVLVGSIAAGLAVIALAVVVALQGVVAPSPSSPPEVGETSQPPTEVAPETSAPPTDPAPSGDTATEGDGEREAPAEPTPSAPAEPAPSSPEPDAPEPEPAQTEPAPVEPAPVEPEPEPTESAPVEPQPEPEPTTAPAPSQEAPPAGTEAGGDGG